MTKRQWSLVIVMILINYLIFSQLFKRIMETASPVTRVATPTAGPTFTPSPVVQQIIPQAPTATPIPPEPTATNTPVIMTDEQRQAMYATQTAQAVPTVPPAPPAEQPTPQPAAPADTRPLVTASQGTVNLRSGPGTNYPKEGSLGAGQSVEIVGRNADSSWWQVSTAAGLRWVAAGVVTAVNAGNAIPVVEVAPPPAPVTPPTATPAPAPTAPPKPQYQYSLINMFGEVNEAITQVRGQIKDSAGNPVNGARVRVRTGGFCTVSVPSGKQGVYPAGNYDILLDVRAKPVDWLVSIVEGPDDPSNFSCDGVRNVLSEEVTASTNNKEGVVYVEWRKNY